MIVHNCEQGGDDWLHLRLGIPTSSCFDEILTPKELTLSKSSDKYLHRLLAEWMYGAPIEAPKPSGWMERGTELEPEAVRYYEMDRDVETATVGLVTTDDGMIGASPDRLVGEDGVLEQKCPSLEFHVGYMLDPLSLVAKYRLQVQGQLWVCQRKWADIQSYCPGFPSVIVRVSAEDKAQTSIGTHVAKFVETMLKCRERLTQEYGELRRERVSAASRLAENHAAFDIFINSGIGGNA